MKLSIAVIVFLLISILPKSSLFAQTISKDELMFLTSEWKGEKFEDGRPKIADNLLERAKRIYIDDAWTVSGNGIVFNGTARDLQEIKNIKGFNAFVRDFHPSFLEEMVLMGLNTPVRIGNVMVLPGDLVIAQREGVLFVPAHMAEQVISTAEFVIRKDQFGFQMVRSGRYSTGQIDSQWSDDIKTEFLKWLDQHPELGKDDKS